MKFRDDYWFLSKFQSYQFRQINPDFVDHLKQGGLFYCFNRINSGRSIPTRLIHTTFGWTAQVSIVSIQADQSRQCLNFVESLKYQCFNRINSGRSIPTLRNSARLSPYGMSFNRINSGRSIPTLEMTGNRTKLR